ncbi:hypothetical protein GCM10022223_56120 [Kineosporia mesophila]|uniref:Uncharacterized protein n=1 Tax=Kineosporia mesophila TaxID=566012 RepID=A0ABP7AFU3_9ACTN|nr:hypothetical protein [Kineosporia mesophila]MCD5354358.1 hypothetical protein [Kineosporia mesophila]
MKKLATVGVVALALGGTVLMSPAAQAATALPATGHQTAYVQRGDTVTVYRDGAVKAKVTAVSSAHPGGDGKLVLTVETKKALSFSAGDWLWEDPSGGDHEADDANRKISVPANTTKKVTIDYTGVGNGDVIWAPGLKTVAGAWYVKGRTVTGASELLPASYVQRGSAVTVYQAGKAVAKVTPTSARHPDGKGTLKLKVEALKKFSFKPAGFVWEDADGGDHQAVNGKKAVTVKAKTNKTITVKYTDVADGALFWSPRADVIAGAWKIG